MKLIRHFRAALGLLLAAAAFAACSDDAAYDFTGDPTNHVYIRTTDQSYVMAHTPVLSISSLDYRLALQCNRVSDRDFTATVDIDNTLIDAYNDANGTQYAALPASALRVENTTLHFHTGATASADSLHITASDNISDCRNAEGYLIPLRIASADIAIADSANATAFVIVNVKEDFDNLYDDPATPKGKLVSDRSGWRAIVPEGSTYSSSYGGKSREPECMFAPFEAEAGFMNYWNGRSAQNEPLVVVFDLGRSYTFDGIVADAPLNGSSAWAKEDIVETSDDNATWTKQGTVAHAGGTQVLYAPVSARYVRVTKPILSEWIHYVYFRCGNFNIYAL